MDAPSLDQIAQRLWSEHKYAILARSKETASTLGGLIAHGDRDPAELVDAIAEAMAGPERDLASAVSEAWQHLLPRVGSPARRAMALTVARNADDARWLMAAVAERVGDAVVASSRLFDHPAAARRLWLRDAIGPTMYVADGAQAVRVAPAEVGQVLVDAYGDAVYEVLRLVAESPRVPSEIAAAVGRVGPRILEGAHRLLILRRIAGVYRSRGDALRVVLAGLGVG